MSSMGEYRGEPFWVAGWRALALAPRCCALNRFGQPCQQPVKAAGDRCRFHVPGRIRAKHKPATGLHAARQQHAARLRALWRRDPWHAGFTVVLDDEPRRALAVWLRANGVHLEWLPPMLVDWVTWRFVQLVRRDELAGPAADRVLDELRRRDALVPDEPTGAVGDLTRASAFYAWRPKLELVSEWVQPSRRKRRLASEAQLQRREHLREQEREVGRAWPAREEHDRGGW